MLGTALASLMRSAWARATTGCRSTPRPTSPPSAVPLAAAAEARRKSRRETSTSGGRAAGLPRARVAAEHLALVLHAVADDHAAAVAALRSHHVDRALEAVEDVAAALLGDLHDLVVVVPARVAARHRRPPFRATLVACKENTGAAIG